MESIVARYTRPWQFYLLATVIPWALWFPAAWASRQGDAWLPAVTALAVAGLFAPLPVVWWVTRDAPDVRRDILRRLVNFREAGPWWLLVGVAIIPAAVLVATAISVVFGYSPDQFGLRGGVTFTAGLLPGWIVLVVAPVVEELAWHSYGTDSLRTRFSLFTTSMIFALIWAVWHAPLALIAGSSQAETAESGWLHALNFPLSFIPFVLLINWVYYRAARNITVTMLFHLAANLITQVLATDPDTEVMTTGLLLVVTGVVLWKERELFFTRPPNARSARSAARAARLA